MHIKYQQFHSNLAAGIFRVLAVGVLMIGLAAGAYAGPVTVAWDRNADAYTAGYNVYRSTQAGVFSAAALNGTAMITSTSFTDATALDGQTYYYMVKAVRADGVQSTSSNEIQVVISNIPALKAPTGLSAQCSADNRNFTLRWSAVTGAANYYVGVDYQGNNSAAAVDEWYVAGSADYYVTQNTGVSFTGAVSPGVTYQWWVGANTTAPGTGPWTGGTSFTCGDGAAPVITMTTPVTGASVSGVFSVSAAASDNVGVVGVQFKVNGASQGAEVTKAPWSTAWDTKTIANASYTLTAVARDLAGNQTTSASTTVTVNNALKAPAGLSAQCSADSKSVTVRWTAVAGATDYYVGIDDKTNNSAAAVDSWYVAGSTDHSVAQNSAVSFTGAVTAGVAYEWWVGTNTTAGAGPWTGGTAFSCGATTVLTMTMTSPASGGTVSGNGVLIRAAASSNAGIVSVQFKANGVAAGAVDTSVPWSASWNTKNKANGTYSLTATATDAAGKTTVSAPLSVKVQNGAASAVEVVQSASSSETQSGYGRPDPQSSVPASQGVAIVSLKNGDIVVSETSVPTAAPVRQGRVYVDAGGAVNTGLAMTNDNDAEARISFYFTDIAGMDFAHGAFTLEARSQKTAFVNEAPFDLPADMRGSMTFEASIPVSVAALRGFINERGEFLMTTVPVTGVGVAPTGNSMVFSHFAEGGGWSTEVVLTNPTDAPLAGTVQFFGPGAADKSALIMTVNGVADSSFSYAIAPRSITRLATGGNTGMLQVGYAVATAAENSAVPQGLLIFSYASEGITVSQAGVPAVSTGTAFRTYVESIGSLRSGLAIANPSGVAAQTTLELTTVDGGATGLTAALEIPAGGHVAQFINELFPTIPEGFQGMLRLVSSQPLGVIGLRTRNNERGDFLVTTMPVTDEASPAPDNAELVFPLVVNGGGYSTEFVGVN